MVDAPPDLGGEGLLQGEAVEGPGQGALGEVTPGEVLGLGQVPSGWNGFIKVDCLIPKDQRVLGSRR